MDKTLLIIFPDEILFEDFIKPLGFSHYCFAHDIDVINQVVHN